MRPLAAAIGIQIGIGTEIDEQARNSAPNPISISTGRMCSKLELLVHIQQLFPEIPVTWVDETVFRTTSEGFCGISTMRLMSAHRRGARLTPDARRDASASVTHPATTGGIGTSIASAMARNRSA